MEPQNAIYDARQLGTPRMLILGFQHLFAMFGATVLVPLLTGLDVSVTLLFAGIGTLLFHFISKWNVPWPKMISPFFLKFFNALYCLLSTGKTSI